MTAAALEEPEVAQLYRDLTQRRRADHLRGIQVFAARGLLREGRTPEQHADALALLDGFDPYQTLVVEFGWSVEELKAWWVDTVRRTVLDLDRA